MFILEKSVLFKNVKVNKTEAAAVTECVNHIFLKTLFFLFLKISIEFDFL